MAHEEPPHIDSSLDPVRAAIRMVADGSAKRITVYSPDTARLLPAARMLARAAGVAVEAAGVTESERDLMVVHAAPRIV